MTIKEVQDAILEHIYEHLPDYEWSVNIGELSHFLNDEEWRQIVFSLKRMFEKV